MSQEVIITLLELVALALPAIGIYLQVLRSLHKPTRKNDIGIDATNKMLDFNLAKFGIFIIIMSGILDIAYLIMVHFPLPGDIQSIANTHAGIIFVILDLWLISSLLLIGFGLLLFAGSVYFSFGFSVMLKENTMKCTISTVWTLLCPCKSFDSGGDPEDED